MKIEILSEKFSKKIYNQLAVHPLQSWQWGQAKKKIGIKILTINKNYFLCCYVYFFFSIVPFAKIEGGVRRVGYRFSY